MGKRNTAQEGADKSEMVTVKFIGVPNQIFYVPTAESGSEREHFRPGETATVTEDFAERFLFKNSLAEKVVD